MPIPEEILEWLHYEDISSGDLAHYVELYVATPKEIKWLRDNGTTVWGSFTGKADCELNTDPLFKKWNERIGKRIFNPRNY